jgi:hypothetical protein
LRISTPGAGKYLLVGMMAVKTEGQSQVSVPYENALATNESSAVWAAALASAFVSDRNTPAAPVKFVPSQVIQPGSAEEKLAVMPMGHSGSLLVETVSFA